MVDTQGQSVNPPLIDNQYIIKMVFRDALLRRAYEAGNFYFHFQFDLSFGTLRTAWENTVDRVYTHSRAERDATLKYKLRPNGRRYVQIKATTKRGLFTQSVVGSARAWLQTTDSRGARKYDCCFQICQTIIPSSSHINSYNLFEITSRPGKLFGDKLSIFMK